MQSLGQMVGMLFLNPISDALGRKVTLYVLWVILLGVGSFSVSIPEVEVPLIRPLVSAPRIFRSRLERLGGGKDRCWYRHRRYPKHPSDLHYRVVPS